jgi:hypothetical protein
MVRREDDKQLKLFRSEESGCTSPAGESPVPESAGAPVAGPQCIQRWVLLRLDVESLCGGSNNAGRNIK